MSVNESVSKRPFLSLYVCKVDFKIVQKVWSELDYRYKVLRVYNLEHIYKNQEFLSKLFLYANSICILLYNK